jgi:putative methyltransferase (TIGR04325 family)
VSRLAPVGRHLSCGFRRTTAHIHRLAGQEPSPIVDVIFSLRIGAAADRREAAIARTTDVLKQLIPPAVLPLARGLVRPLRTPEWSYVGERWPTGDPRAEGWRHPSVVDAQRNRWAGFVAAIQSTGPPGVSHEAARIESTDPSAHNAIMTFAYVLARAAGTRSAIAVLDWGGGLGYYAAIARALLPCIALDWTVKEISAVCDEGRRLNPDVTFTSDSDAALAHRYDLVFASNSIQYAEDWRALLVRLAGAAARWMFLTRVPLVERAAGFVVAQRPHHVGYRTEYLSWVFNRGELLAHASAVGLALKREFLMVAERNEGVAGAPEANDNRGFLFRARD